MQPLDKVEAGSVLGGRCDYCYCWCYCSCECTANLELTQDFARSEAKLAAKELSIDAPAGPY